MKIRYLIIDGNSLGYSCYFGRKKTNDKGEPVGALLGFIQAMHRLLSHYSGFIPIILWDGKADWRMNAYPNYKIKRINNLKLKERKADYKPQQALIVQAMSSLGVMQVVCPVAEADDLAYTISSELLHQSSTEQIVHLTTDSDWWQLITDSRVSVEDFRFEFSLGTSNYEAITGLPDHLQFIDAKCLAGDKSDSILAVRGFQDDSEKAKSFVKQWGSVLSFYTRAQELEKLSLLEQTFPEGTLERSLLHPESRNRFELNKKLIDLSKAPIPPIGEVSVDTGSWNESEFFKLCKEQSLHSITKKPDYYLRPFSNMASKHDVAKSLIYKITL